MSVGTCKFRGVVLLALASTLHDMDTLSPDISSHRYLRALALCPCTSCTGCCREIPGSSCGTSLGCPAFYLLSINIIELWLIRLFGPESTSSTPLATLPPYASRGTLLLRSQRISCYWDAEIPGVFCTPSFPNLNAVKPRLSIATTA